MSFGPLFICLIAILLHMRVYATDVCQDLLRTAISKYETNGMLFVPSREQFEYDQISNINRSKDYYLKDVFLNLENESQIEWIASLLSENNDPQIMKTILLKKFRMGAKRISLNEILPPHIAKRTGQAVSCYEGNCFNAALRWADSNILSGNTTIKEINDTLWFDYQYLESGSRLRFGDLIVIRQSNKSSNNNIIHTARYLDSNLVWHKKGQGINRPWAYEPLLNAVRTYYRITMGQIYFEFYRKK